MADSDFKTQVLAATDIVTLISRTVVLKRRGKNFVGLCPFHNEKTASFNVDPTRGYFKCFGCKAFGNAIDFVMRRDRLDFVEAMKALGQEAGLEMPAMGISKEKTSERQALFDIHLQAAELFHANLLHPIVGKPAREYLDQRGFTDETIQRFKVGFAPPGWDGLLKSKAFVSRPPELMVLAGLAKARDGGGHYDTFRNRLMFPIRDGNGRTIAFGGRVMPGSDDPAKYLNSPETPLFSKSKSIYGLDLARDLIVESGTVAITEGYTDTAMAHQFGATNVVSILGTAMTEQHLLILRRFASRIVLLFDADTAGDTAANRSVEQFLSSDVEIAVATIPEDLDPDEYLLKHGVEAFNNLLKTAPDALTFTWKLLQRQITAAKGSVTAQQKAVESYLNLLSKARESGPVDTLRWGIILSRVERLTGIPTAELRQKFGDTHQQRGHNKRTYEVKSLDNSATSRQILTARDRAEAWILGILLAQPSQWVHVQSTILLDHFADPLRRRLAEIYWDIARNEGEMPFAELLGELLDDELKGLAILLLEEVEKLGNHEATLSGSIKYLLESAAGQSLKPPNAIETLAESTGPAGNQPRDDEKEKGKLRDWQQRMSKPDMRRLGPRR